MDSGPFFGAGFAKAFAEATLFVTTFGAGFAEASRFAAAFAGDFVEVAFLAPGVLAAGVVRLGDSGLDFLVVTGWTPQG